MNFVLVNCTYETFTPAHSGAIGTWVREICKAAESDGTRPLLISRRSTHPQYERPDTIFIDYPHLPGGRILSKALGLQKQMMGWVRPRQEAWCARVADAIRACGADGWPLVLHNDMELAVSLRRRLPASPIVHLAHNHNGTTERYRRAFPRSVDAALAVSDYAARWNERFFAMPAGSIHTLHNGVDLQAFGPRQRDESALPLVNFVGKLVPEKGPDVLLKAAIRLASRTRDFAVQIVGRQHYDRDEAGDYTRELQSLAEQLRSAGVACRFSGWVARTNLPDVLGAADINVTPSRWDEPFGLTTLEAMACGLAVIGANTGGTAEVIGDAGFLFDRADEAALADLLKRLIRHPALRIEYGQRARTRAEQFSWRRTWLQLRDILSLIMS